MLEECKIVLDEIDKSMQLMEKQLKALEILSTLTVAVVLGLLIYIAVF